jgi:hypothetical protein
VIVYNSVEQNLWFGNKSSNFVLTNQNQLKLSNTIQTILCNLEKLPESTNWGLPYYLGFSLCPAYANASTINPLSGEMIYPRFYYGDAFYLTGDNGYWLKPDPEYKGGVVYYLNAPSKINLMGDSYIYMEIAGQNNIDETSPFNVSKFTIETNQTNGIVNSSFAKIAVVTTPISQWFDYSSEITKVHNPPLERIRRLKIKLRYHNNQIVNFGNFDYSFTLIFHVFRSQINRNYNIN